MISAVIVSTYMICLKYTRYWFTLYTVNTHHIYPRYVDTKLLAFGHFALNKYPACILCLVFLGISVCFIAV